MEKPPAENAKDNTTSSPHDLQTPSTPIIPFCHLDNSRNVDPKAESRVTNQDVVVLSDSPPPCSSVNREIQTISDKRSQTPEEDEPSPKRLCPDIFGGNSYRLNDVFPNANANSFTIFSLPRDLNLKNIFNGLSLIHTIESIVDNRSVLKLVFKTNVDHDRARDRILNTSVNGEMVFHKVPGDTMIEYRRVAGQVHGAMASQVHGAMASQVHGAMASQVHGAMASQVHGAMPRQVHGAMARQEPVPERPQPYQGNDDSSSEEEEIAAPQPSFSQQDPCIIDPEGLYGLNLEFLEALNITPPIYSWVFVSNYKCSTSELRELMEVVGLVVRCTVTNSYAKVHYSHPLEAIQAVSLLNRQIFNGLTLIVVMAESPKDAFILPTGLGTIGYGLGSRGKLIKDVVKEYINYLKKQPSELDPMLFRRNVADDEQSRAGGSQVNYNRTGPTAMTNNERSSRNTHVDEHDENYNLRKTSYVLITPSNNDRRNIEQSVLNDSPDSSAVAGYTYVNINRQNTSIRTGAPGVPVSYGPHVQLPIRQSSILPSSDEMPTYIGRNAIVLPSPQQMSDFMFRQLVNEFGRDPLSATQNAHRDRESEMPGPSGLNRMTGPRWEHGAMQMQNGTLIGNRQTSKPRTFNSTAPGLYETTNRTESVQFRNLPPEISFQYLSEQVSNFGQVVLLRFTSPGCAIVTFNFPTQAERCLQHYDGMEVSGRKLSVTYV